MWFLCATMSQFMFSVFFLLSMVIAYSIMLLFWLITDVSLLMLVVNTCIGKYIHSMQIPQCLLTQQAYTLQPVSLQVLQLVSFSTVCFLLFSLYPLSLLVSLYPLSSTGLSLPADNACIGKYIHCMQIPQCLLTQQAYTQWHHFHLSFVTNKIIAYSKSNMHAFFNCIKTCSYVHIHASRQHSIWYTPYYACTTGVQVWYFIIYR